MGIREHLDYALILHLQKLTPRMGKTSHPTASREARGPDPPATWLRLLPLRPFLTAGHSEPPVEGLTAQEQAANIHHMPVMSTVLFDIMTALVKIE